MSRDPSFRNPDWRDPEVTDMAGGSLEGKRLAIEQPEGAAMAHVFEALLADIGNGKTIDNERLVRCWDVIDTYRRATTLRHGKGVR